MLSQNQLIAKANRDSASDGSLSQRSDFTAESYGSNEYSGSLPKVCHSPGLAGQD